MLYMWMKKRFTTICDGRTIRIRDRDEENKILSLSSRYKETLKRTLEVTCIDTELAKNSVKIRAETREDKKQKRKTKATLVCQT